MTVPGFFRSSSSVLLEAAFITAAAAAAHAAMGSPPALLDCSDELLAIEERWLDLADMGWAKAFDDTSGGREDIPSLFGTAVSGCPGRTVEDTEDDEEAGIEAPFALPLSESFLGNAMTLLFCAATAVLSTIFLVEDGSLLFLSTDTLLRTGSPLGDTFIVASRCAWRTRSSS